MNNCKNNGYARPFASAPGRTYQQTTSQQRANPSQSPQVTHNEHLTLHARTEYAKGQPYANACSRRHEYGAVQVRQAEPSFEKPRGTTPGGGSVSSTVDELLAFQTDPTFFLPLSRVQAEQLLLSYPPDSALARPSSVPGGGGAAAAGTTAFAGTATVFAVSFRKAGSCYHVRVDVSTDRGYPLLQTCDEHGAVSVYGSIASLLEHLEVSRIRGDDATYGAHALPPPLVRTYAQMNE